MSNAAVDLRGFVYPLSALLEKHRWELELLQMKTAQVQAKLVKLEVRLSASKKSYSTQNEYLSASMQRRPDPIMYRRALDYLVKIRGEIVGMEQEELAIKEEKRALLESSIGQQRKIQMLEEHQATQLAEYAAAEQTRLASELDREWSARNIWQSRTGLNGEEMFRKATL